MKNYEDEATPAQVARLIEALRKIGVNIPDGIDTLDDLCLAIDMLAANMIGPHWPESGRRAWGR